MKLTAEQEGALIASLRLTGIETAQEWMGGVYMESPHLSSRICYDSFREDLNPSLPMWEDLEIQEVLIQSFLEGVKEGLGSPEGVRPPASGNPPAGTGGLPAVRSADSPPRVEDYGADPIGDGTFRMLPSGDIVSYEERKRRLSLFEGRAKNDCFGLSWDQIEAMQGGKLRR